MPTTQKGRPNQAAERLKNQGNDLHKKGQYREAYRKYTEAIKEDPKNAIYYANRAASSLELKEYLDAAADAAKATDLDPLYVKGWARLATASFELSSFARSVSAWQKGLECLPPAGADMTPTEKTLRYQFEVGLNKAEKAKSEPYFNAGRMTTAKPGDMPWDRALAMEKKLIADKNPSTSAFVILMAEKDYAKGVEIMKTIKRTTLGGQDAFQGTSGALVEITNGILRDPRVFRIDCPDWFIKYNDQAMFECQAFKAWDRGGAKTIQEEAPKRLKREGWDSVRRALSITIRAWLMCGFISSSSSRHLVAMEYYSRILEVLEWGYKIWHDVPTEDRGVIFELTFIRGIKRLHLSCMHETVILVTEKPQIYSRERLVETCHELIADTEANPPTPTTELDPGFYFSFWAYPKGEALCILGWHHMQLGAKANDFSTAKAEYSKSAQYYIESAQCFPEDEERHACFLKVAVEAHWCQGSPLLQILPLIARIREVVPRMIAIWEKSQLLRGRDSTLEQALAFEVDCVMAIAQGRFSIHDIVKPRDYKPKDKWGKQMKVIYI